DRSRTCDLMLPKHALFQLSYTPLFTMYYTLSGSLTGYYIPSILCTGSNALRVGLFVRSSVVNDHRLKAAVCPCCEGASVVVANGRDTLLNAPKPQKKGGVDRGIRRPIQSSVAF
ncbi:MAG TPA: hypothetical protein VKV29_11090, partial [Chthonomonas sp.]|uniref:hypothetical protein n=1 Tax=Chthonomonas sp. TaxID=2282153 RepID=UPI002B4B49D0